MLLYAMEYALSHTESSEAISNTVDNLQLRRPSPRFRPKVQRETASSTILGSEIDPFLVNARLIGREADSLITHAPKAAGN